MPAKKIPENAKELNRKIGERVKAYRLQKGLTLKQVAEKLGVTLNQVALYERGSGDLSVSKLKALADVFQIPVYELFPEQKDTDYVPLSVNLIKLLNYINRYNLNVALIYKHIRSLKEGNIL